MFGRTAAVGFTAAALAAGGAAAQMAVTTFGASDAAQCFENASNDFSRDAAPCDVALRNKALSRADRYRTLVNRGIIRNRNGDLSGAISDFDEALSLNAGLGEAYLNRGNAYYLSGQFDTAIADYETALANDVNKPWAAWYNIGLAYDAMKNGERARAAYEKALELNPDFAPAHAKLDAG
jgi:tetratricopeptide (TPR) repeat protein